MNPFFVVDWWYTGAAELDLLRFVVVVVGVVGIKRELGIILVRGKKEVRIVNEKKIQKIYCLV